MSCSGFFKYMNVQVILISQLTILSRNNLQSNSETEDPPLPEPLLVILNEKNKSIEKLKTQLHNQKIQLEFYLKKQLNSPKIVELSQTCTPKAITESIPLTLAVNKFYKDIGIENQIKFLHDDMCKVSKRANFLLQSQECILREILKKTCNFLKYENIDNSFTVQLRNAGTDMYYMQLFNTLLNATINLRKELSSYRICCDRLILLEDERNALVEQVYSLPAEQRTNCNYLIGIQMEKFQIENGMKQNLKARVKLQKKISELDIIENNLKKLQSGFNSTFSNGSSETSRIKTVLENVNAEAMQLLAVSRKRKAKYTKEVTELKEENIRLHEMLEDIKTNGNNNNKDNDSSGSDNIASRVTLKNEIDGSGEKSTHQLELKNKECEILKQQLLKIIRDKEEMKMATEKAKFNLDQMKNKHLSEIEAIRKEFATYKKQIGNMVLNKTVQTPTQIDNLEKRIDELEAQNEALRKKAKHSKEMIFSLNRQVVQLLEIVKNSTKRPEAQNNCVNSIIELFSKGNKDLLNKNIVQPESSRGPSNNDNNNPTNSGNNNPTNSNNKDDEKMNKNKCLPTSSVSPEKSKINQKSNTKSTKLSSGYNKSGKTDFINLGSGSDGEELMKTDGATAATARAASPPRPTRVEFKSEIVTMNQRTNTHKETDGVRKESKKNKKQSHAWVNGVTANDTNHNIFNKVYTYWGDVEKSMKKP